MVADDGVDSFEFGKTGAGKSTLIVHMAVDDVKAGRGAVVVDPRGDMINDILDRVLTYREFSLATRTGRFAWVR